MSDSTPNPAPDADQRPGAAPAGLSPGAASPRWWVASILFHAALLAWLLFFAPVRVFDPAAKPEAAPVSAARAREVVEDIRVQQAGSLEASLRTLEDIRRRMTALEDRKRADFTTFARETGKDAPAKAAAAQDAMAKAGAAALAALDHAGESATGYLQTRANTFFDELADAHKLASAKQAEIRDLQDQALEVLSLGDVRFAAAARAQTEAGAAQDRADKALADAEAARNPSWDSRKRTARENQIDHYTYEIRRANNAVLQADANLAELKTQIAVDTTVVARTTADAGEAAAEAAAHPSDQTRLAADKAQKAATTATRDLAADQKRLADHPKDVADAIKRLPGLAASLAEYLAAPEPQSVALTPQDQKLASLQATARQLQFEAVQAQQRAAVAAAALAGAGSDSNGATTALAALDAAAPAEPLPPPAAPGSLNLAQIYEASVRTEGALTQSYRRLRATDLAMIRHLPLSRAIELTDVAKALRPDLAGALQSTVASGEDLPAAREAIQTARAEMDAMVRLASSLLSQAEALDDTAGATVSADDYNRKYEQWEKMQELAAEDEGQWAKDVTGAMDGGAGQAGDGNPSGEGGDGTGGAGSGNGGGGGGGGQLGGSGGANLGKSGVAGPFGSGTGSGLGSGMPGLPGGVGGFGKGGIPGAKGAAGAPEDVSTRVIPTPGRRVAARGPSANWFFVDSWYILGPFDNTNRANIDRKFPPETVVDLNATYAGKNGVPIHWEFHQSSKPNVMPQLDGYNAAVQNPAQTPDANFRHNLEYIIYYGYTELWFEKACDLWVAIGSDDSAKVWVEDQLVWVSGKNLKAWSLNEGLRKVHFKQGVNRVLYRVENANSRTEFSMVVSMLP